MSIILEQLVILVSPVLSFTAEEIWQGNDFLKTKAKSVFLASLSNIENFESDLSKENWSRLIEIKEEVNQSIEAARSQGDIKGSLDASINLSLIHI